MLNLRLDIMHKVLLGGILGYVVARLGSSSAFNDTEREDAIDTEFQLWKVKESMRQGEMALQYQGSTWASLMGQTTTLLGWMVTGISAAGGIAFGASRYDFRLAAVILIAGWLATASICIFSIRPRLMSTPGFNPPQIWGSTLADELTLRVALMEGVTQGIEQNRLQIAATRKLLLAAWIIFVATPLLGVGYLVFETLISMPIHV
jgi:hypothetical protein